MKGKAPELFSVDLITELTIAALRAHSRPLVVPSGIVWQVNYPDIQGKGEDTKNKNYFKDLAAQQAPKAETAITTAAKPGGEETRLLDYNNALWDWKTGKSGPIDVRNMPGGGPAISLFNDAKVAHDANRIGRGVNSMGDGVNPAFAASLNKQNDLERDVMAKGALENDVNATLGANTAAMGGLADTENARNMNIAGMQNSNYQNALSRYLDAAKSFRTPNFFRQLAMQFAQGTGQGLAMGAGA